jgi:hypothetical protein
MPLGKFLISLRNPYKWNCRYVGCRCCLVPMEYQIGCDVVGLGQCGTYRKVSYKPHPLRKTKCSVQLDMNFSPPAAVC